MPSTSAAQTVSAETLGGILQPSSNPSTANETSDHKTKHNSEQPEAPSSKAGSKLHSNPESRKSTSDFLSDGKESSLGRATTGVETEKTNSAALRSSSLQTPISGHADTTSSEGTSTTVGSLDISTDSQGQYIINGLTFAPGIPLTMTRDGGPVTFEMLTTGTQTYIAVGMSTTIRLDGANQQNRVSTDHLSALAFTRASDGIFVLHGTTLVPGSPVTIGSGISKTTLEITTIHHTPAVVVDGTLTQRLGYDEPSRVGIASASPADVTTPPLPSVSAPTQTSRESTVSSGAGFATARYARCQNWSILALSLVAAVWR